MKKTLLFLSGILIGLLNILLSAGAGIIAVILLRRQGFSQKQAQANAIAVMLPVSIISLIIYFLNGYVNLYGNIFIVLTGITGALAGSLLLKKITPKHARILLGVFTVFAGIRILISL